MNNFWKARAGTFFWGWAISWSFTGHFFQGTLMFLTIAFGNTAIMWYFLRHA